MSNLKIDLSATTRGTPNLEVAEDAELMGTLAARATATTNHRDRATVYGFTLHTCANCHLIVRSR